MSVRFSVCRPNICAIHQNDIRSVYAVVIYTTFESITPTLTPSPNGELELGTIIWHWKFDQTVAGSATFALIGVAKSWFGFRSSTTLIPIPHNVEYDVLYISTGNDVTIHFRSAANRTHVSILGRARVAISRLRLSRFRYIYVCMLAGLCT